MLSRRILAGHGFRTTPEAHRELATLTDREVLSLELVDPRLFHLDLALAVLDDEDGAGTAKARRIRLRKGLPHDFGEGG